MIEKLTSWVLTRTQMLVNDVEELTGLELLGKIGNKINELIDNLNNKVDQGGNFTGTWRGLVPTQTNEAIQSQVDKNVTDIQEINNNMETFQTSVTNSINTQLAPINTDVSALKSDNAIRKKTVIDIRDFGAKSILEAGNENFDSWQSIQNAIDSIPKADLSGNGNGGVIIGRGVFLISKPLLINNHNITFKGVNSGAFTIKASDNFVGDSILHVINTGWQFVKSVHIEDLSIDGNNKPAYGLNMEGVYNDIVIRNVNIDKFKDYFGLYVHAGTSGMDVCQGVLIENVHVNPRNTTAYGSVRLKRVQESTLINVKAWSQDSNGVKNSCEVIRFDSCRGVNVIGGAGASGKYGYQINSVFNAVGLPSKGVNLIGVTVEDISDTGILVTGDEVGSKACYCYIGYPRVEGTVPKTIVLDYATGCRVDLCTEGAIVNLLANSSNNLIVGENATITNSGSATNKKYTSVSA